MEEDRQSINDARNKQETNLSAAESPRAFDEQRLMFNLLQVFVQYEHDMHSERVKRGMREAAAKKRAASHQVPNKCCKTETLSVYVRNAMTLK